jgi:hypothetical protein
MRMCLDGEPPQSADDRMLKDKLVLTAKAYKNKYSPFLLAAIDAALSLNAMLRPRSAEEMLAMLRP